MDIAIRAAAAPAPVFLFKILTRPKNKRAPFPNSAAGRMPAHPLPYVILLLILTLFMGNFISHLCFVFERNVFDVWWKCEESVFPDFCFFICDLHEQHAEMTLPQQSVKASEAAEKTHILHKKQKILP